MPFCCSYQVLCPWTTVTPLPCQPLLPIHPSAFGVSVAVPSTPHLGDFYFIFWSRGLCDLLPLTTWASTYRCSPSGALSWPPNPTTCTPKSSWDPTSFFRVACIQNLYFLSFFLFSQLHEKLLQKRALDALIIKLIKCLINICWRNETISRMKLIMGKVGKKQFKHQMSSWTTSLCNFFSCDYLVNRGRGEPSFSE